jgi:hypothetical protein
VHASFFLSSTPMRKTTCVCAPSSSSYPSYPSFSRTRRPSSRLFWSWLRRGASAFCFLSPHRSPPRDHQIRPRPLCGQRWILPMLRSGFAFFISICPCCATALAFFSFPSAKKNRNSKKKQKNTKQKTKNKKNKINKKQKTKIKK